MLYYRPILSRKMMHKMTFRELVVKTYQLKTLTSFSTELVELTEQLFCQSKKELSTFFYLPTLQAACVKKGKKICMFKSILKISHSNYLQFCSKLPVKFAIFSISSLLLTSFFFLAFLFISKTWFNNLKPRIHSFFYKNNFIRTRASYLTKS